MMAITRPVDYRRARIFVELPPGHQRWIIRHRDNRHSRETPERPFDPLGAVECIHTPVVGRLILQGARIKTKDPHLPRGARGVSDLVGIGPEVNGVHDCVHARLPAQIDVGGFELRSVHWIGIVSRLEWDRKAPDLPAPGAIGVGFVDLVHPPVVGRPRRQTVGVRKSGKTNDLECRCHITDERAFRACFDILKIFS